jgi:ABC-2 type transport system ATP-binding protein
MRNGHLLIDLHGESKIGPLVRLIVESGGLVEEIRRGRASLEEVFLTLMEEDKR